MAKLNLTADPSSHRNGYVNADPARGSLDGLVEAGEASEVVALGVVERFRPEQQRDAVRHWASRLAPGGTITVSATDLWELARSVVLGTTGEGEAVALLYGSAGGRRAVLWSERTLSDELRDCGLEVVSRRLEGETCVVTARRPL